MADFSLKITNATAQGLQFALYRKQPGLKTLPWKVLSLSRPHPGNPTIGTVPWSLTYQVTVPKQVNGSWVGGLSLDAKEGCMYELQASQDGSNQIIEVGEGTPGFINFLNNTTSSENMGLMVDGVLESMQENVAGGVKIQFMVKVPQYYYLGVFTQITKGAFTPSDSIVRPIEIHFPSGKNTATVTTGIQGGQVVVSDPMYN